MTHHSEIVGGKPTIRGMRVTVGMIVRQIGAGHCRRCAGCAEALGGACCLKGGTWKELIAADMNHDSRVTAADALEILKVSVGLNTIQPSWVFVPSDAATNPNLVAMTKSTVSYKDDLNFSSITAPTSATITGILVGDVNNSWVIPS